MNSTLDTNRSFLYGDGFFETLKLINGHSERFAMHYQRILASCGILMMHWNNEWTRSYFEEKLFSESKNFEASVLKVRIIFYRSARGNYIPEDDTIQFYIRLEPYFSLTKTILKAGVYPFAKKPCNFLSALKTTSSLMFVMAGKYSKDKGWDETIILNEYGRVCEALTSNIFLKIGDIFYTPPLSEGCIDGVNRKAFLLENKNSVERPIEVDELRNHPIFFSNAVRGMMEGEFIWEEDPNSE